MLSWHAVGIACFVVLSLMAVALRSPRARRRMEPWSGVVVPAGAVALAAMYAGCAIRYLALPHFYDHVEPSMVSIARAFEGGRPLYPEFDSGMCYALPYGPAAYLVPGVCAGLVGDPILGGKIPGVAFGLAAGVLTILAVRRLSPSRSSLLIATMFFCGMAFLCPPILLWFGAGYHWVRADSQMLFWVAFGTFGLTRKNHFLSAVLVGVALGASFLTKVHGPLYLAPLLAAVSLSRSPKEWGVLLLTSAVVVVSPYCLLPGLSISGQFSFLRMVAGHGPGWLEMILVALSSVALAIPVALRCAGEDRPVLAMIGRPDVPRWQARLAAVSTLLCVGMVLALASKRGAGAHHVLPFLPVATLFAAGLAEQSRSKEWAARALRRLRGMAVPLAGGAVVLAAVTCVDWLMPYSAAPPQLREAAREMEDILSRYPQHALSMGYGDNAAWRLASLRAALPPGSPLLIEPPSLMDYRAAGLAIPRRTIEALRAGDVPLWLIPKNSRPFSMKNLYDGGDLFGEEFRRVFGEEYTLIEEGRFFGVWIYRSRLTSGPADCPR